MNGLIKEAIKYAQMWHSWQTRKVTGEPYINHLMRVAGHVQMRHPEATDLICAAWLHDSIEDANVTHKMIRNLFNREVADIVWGVTNPSEVNPEYKGLPRKQRKEIDFTHISYGTWNVQTLKACDRLDNVWSSFGRPRKFLEEKYIPETYKLIEAMHLIDSKLVHDLETAVLLLIKG